MGIEGKGKECRVGKDRGRIEWVKWGGRGLRRREARQGEGKEGKVLSAHF